MIVVVRLVANEPHDLVWQTVAGAPYPDSVEWQDVFIAIGPG